MATPYEPPPDYPMVEEEWRANEDSKLHYRHSAVADVRIPPSAATRQPNQRLFRQHNQQHHHDVPVRHSSVERDRHYRYPGEQYYDPFLAAHAEMLRTRQFPEVAGIYRCEEQPALRRFTRYNQSMMGVCEPQIVPPPSSSFSKSSKKKPSFFVMGNWTFRDRKQTRPSIAEGLVREERPQSMNLSELRSVRSRSEATSRASPQPSTANDEFPRGSEFRVPVRIERSSMAKKSAMKSPVTTPPPPAPPTTPTTTTATPPATATTTEFKTNITVDDVAILRPKKEIENNNNNTNNNRFSFQSCLQMRKSCPDLDAANMTHLEQQRVSKKRNRRAKEKASHAAWRRKRVQDWTLDDVLLWLQSCQLDDVASLLIGYDLRGDDLLQWDHQTLTQLGVSEEVVRVKILDELAAVLKAGPVEDEPDRRSQQPSSHKTLFDIVRLTSYDQVLAVETPLTTRDITVTHGRLGCLQITKVNGANLPLREHDCLLEINERPGEQFKSALMLTKLISDSNGVPIRFVILRRKSNDDSSDSPNERSSSGISSSPQTPTE